MQLEAEEEIWVVCKNVCKQTVLRALCKAVTLALYGNSMMILRSGTTSPNRGHLGKFKIVPHTEVSFIRRTNRRTNQTLKFVQKKSFPHYSGTPK